MITKSDTDKCCQPETTNTPPV